MPQCDMSERSSSIDLSVTRPAAVLVIDLVKHSSRSNLEAAQIQRALEEVLRETLDALGIQNVLPKYTGDGYLCAFLGDSSARVIDFINMAMPALLRRLGMSKQAFRAGLDFGILELRSNDVTGDLEHFDQAGIRAARLESAAQSNQVLCSETVFNLFAAHYPGVFGKEPVTVTTKDRILKAYEIRPFDYGELQQAFADYIYGPPQGRYPIADLGARRRILIVDDDPGVCSILAHTIHKWRSDLEVVEALSADGALEVFEPGSFAVVITDIVLPGRINGLELAERLLSCDPEVVLIAMSGYVCGVEGFYEIGGFRFHPKPFHPSQMEATLEMALNGRLPRLFRSLNLICHNRGVLLQKVQKISDSVYSILQHAKKEGHLAHSLLRHKLKHTIVDFVKSVCPGTDIAEKAEAVCRQAECLARLAWVTAKAAESAFPLFLRQYVNDLKKQHRGIKVHLRMQSSVDEVIGGCSAETIFALITCELLDNAISALAGKGHISVDVEHLQSTKQLSIVVRDDGPGVARANLSRLFQEGFSTKGPARDLGLHLVQEAVRQLGGKVEYETVNGACFSVVIPIEPQPSAKSG